MQALLLKGSLNGIIYVAGKRLQRGAGAVGMAKSI
jgi:hypothetical protein